MRAECAATIEQIRARALEDARDEVKTELEEARQDAATAEAQVDDIREELERMQTDSATASEVHTYHCRCSKVSLLPMATWQWRCEG